MMLQYFVSRVSSATLTCCNICILMFHCDLANVGNVEFRCCRHVMLVLCQGGGGGGRAHAACSLGLSATSQQYFPLTTNQPPATSQQYSSLRTNQHESSATSQPNRLMMFGCCTHHGSQHGPNIVATCGEGKRKTPNVWMLHITSFATCSEHVRNIVR
jgi:hypothetical protein